VGDLGGAGESGGGSDEVLAAPAVRRLARDLGIKLSRVKGTGIGGRVTSHDVQAAALDGGRPDRAPTRQAARIGAVRIPFRGVRRTIAEHLRYSVSHAVHYTVMDEADVTALDALRRKLVAASNEKISLLPFVAVAVCRVLSGRTGAKFTRLNSTVDDEKQEIVQHTAVHLGVATDTESGLMVPVVRDADHLGVLELSRRIAQLALAARDRELKPDQLSGSTFTISNIGPMGGRFGTPIINYPEAGILAIGRAREGVVVRDGMLGVGKLLPLSLSADHRVIDGAAAATALAKIIGLLQSPEELLPAGEEG
jgi:pyruvate dehydrogenase E2 component (dihydrolipoamide acetyltransferase)